MSNARTITVSGLVLAALFAAGLVRFFLLRFEAGDVYPPYSSLRSDPLGTRALHDSLAACPGLHVERSFEPPRRRASDGDTVLLFLGDTFSRYDRIDRDTAARLTGFLARGGRMAFTFMPRRGDRWQSDEDEDDEDDENETTDEDDEAQDADPNASGTNAVVSADETNGVWFALGTNAPASAGSTNRVARDDKPLKRRRDRRDRTSEWVFVRDWLEIDVGDQPLAGPTNALRTAEAAYAALPAAIPCRTSMVFTNWVPAFTNDPSHPRPAAATNASPWQTVYARDGHPVVVERRVGRGSVALCAPSFLVSNEALRSRRETAFLLWLLGGRTRVVFDEYHHGLSREGNLATLARQYRLHGLAAGLALLAALFLWQRSASLVPRRERGALPDWDLAEGKGSTPGLVNLLRRSVPARAVLRTAFDRWRRTQPAPADGTAGALRRMEAVLQAQEQLPPHKRNAAQAYNEMAAIWKREHGG